MHLLKDLHERLHDTIGRLLWIMELAVLAMRLCCARFLVTSVLHPIGLFNLARFIPSVIGHATGQVICHAVRHAFGREGIHLRIGRAIRVPVEGWTEVVD